MNSKLLPAEHLFALALNLAIIAVSIVSISQMVPQFLDLQAKRTVLDQESKQLETHLQSLENQARQNRQTPQQSARRNANLTHQDSVSIFFKD